MPDTKYKIQNTKGPRLAPGALGRPQEEEEEGAEIRS